METRDKQYQTISNNIKPFRTNSNQLKLYQTTSNHIKLLTLLSLLTVMNCQSPKDDSALHPPNVILIMTDDQGYGDLACHGNPYIKTPNLDKLHSQSIRLTNFHVGTTCSPTRAGLMTGRNGNRVGVWHTIAGRSQLDASEMTMADVFATSGYETGMFGKWHLGDSYPFRPHDRGFDEAFYHGGGGVWQQPDYWDNDYFSDTYFRNGVPEETEGYCTDVWFDAALDFIDENRNRPFFAYIPTNAPHGPFHVDSTYIRMYREYENINANFYGMITNIDDNVGRLMQKLEELKLADNTLLIFMTDNGTARGVSFDEEGNVKGGYNSNMRGTKGSQYEGGHRVPCFLRWPDKGIKGGKDVDALTAHVDLLPTLIQLLELNPPRTVEYDGASIVELLEGNTEDTKWSDRVLITDTQRAELPTKWKKSATMMDKWRLINGKELYDLREDPGQRNDISEQHPFLVANLTAAYENWWSGIELGFDEYTRAVLGPASGETVILYSHDWHEAENNLGEPNISGEGSHTTPWNHHHIRNGILVNGYWTVEVAQSGTFNFELRRWPEELDLSITAGTPEKAAVPGGRPFPEGKALDIIGARIKVGEKEASQKLEDSAKKATFQMNLEEGKTQIKTWFEGENDVRLGAYYVYATRTR